MDETNKDQSNIPSESSNSNYFLANELGPANDIDKTAMDAYLLAIQSVNPELAGLSRLLAKRATEIRYDSDDFPKKVYPVFERTKKLMVKIKEQQKNPNTMIDEIDDGGWNYYFMQGAKHGKYVVGFRNPRMFGRGAFNVSRHLDLMKSLKRQVEEQYITTAESERIDSYQGIDTELERLRDKENPELDRFFFCRYIHDSGFDSMFQARATFDNRIQAKQAWEKIQNSVNPVTDIK